MNIQNCNGINGELIVDLKKLLAIGFWLLAFSRWQFKWLLKANGQQLTANS